MSAVAKAPELHRLKIDAQPMSDLLSGNKTCEIRTDDRGFAVGDHVHLVCADGRETNRTISHIQRGYGLPDGMCVLSYPADLAVHSAPAEVEGLRIIIAASNNVIDGLTAENTALQFENARLTAAQADYEARILAAIQPDPEPQPVSQAALQPDLNISPICQPEPQPVAIVICKGCGKGLRLGDAHDCHGPFTTPSSAGTVSVEAAKEALEGYEEAIRDFIASEGPSSAFMPACLLEAISSGRSALRALAGEGGR